MSERVCEVVCIAFAWWTVCFHAAVAFGGGLGALLVLYALTSGALAFAWLQRLRRRRGAPTVSPEASEAFEPTSKRLCALGWARGLAFGGGTIALAAFVCADDAVALWWWGVVSLGGAAVLFVLAEPPRPSRPAVGRGREIALWTLAVACAALVLFVNRPDADDAFYVNVAVAAADDPAWPLLSADTMHGIEGLPLHLPAHRLHSFEVVNGALAFLTGIPAIVCFHWIAASLAALLVLLAHAALFRLLTPRVWPWAVAALVVVLLAAGETGRWYGNYAFVRIWQGKSIYLSVFMPLVYTYALRFALRPSAAGWLLLTAAQVGAVGCSASAVWGAPIGALATACCALRPSRRGLRIFAAGALASLYPLAVGWLVKGSVQDLLRPSLSEAQMLGEPLLAALDSVMGTSRLQIAALAATLLAWACSRRGLAQRFAIVVPLAVWLVLLNPYAASWVRSNLTGPAYWRSLWSLPVPILVVLVLTTPLQLARGPRQRAIARATGVLLLAAFALAIPQYGALSRANNTRLAPRPTLKVQPMGYRWARELADRVPPRSIVVAPREVSLYLATFHHHAYPLMVRHYLDLQRDRIGRVNYQMRNWMTRYVGGQLADPAAHAVFRRGLEVFGVEGVCLRRSPYAPEAQAILRQAGFERTLAGASHEIWIRPRPATPPDR